VIVHQHSIGNLGDSFTGQKTQPTVSKYWRKRQCGSVKCRHSWFQAIKYTSIYYILTSLTASSKMVPD